MSLLKSSLFFAVGTFLSRISGLVRESVLGGVFGASLLLDSFLVAFRIPNLFREMLAEGALASAFTKVYSQVSEIDKTRATQLLVQTFYLFSLFSMLISVLGVIFAPYLVKAMSINLPPEYSEGFLRNATGLTRIVFPFLGIAMLGSIFMGALHQKGSFFTSAVSPICFNLGYILGALVLAGIFEEWSPPWMLENFGEPKIVGLAVGVMIGGFCQLLVQIYACKEKLENIDFGLFRRLPWSSDLKDVVKLMIPASIAAGAGPVNVFINTNFATSLGEGAVSWLSYAFRLLQLPIGLFGVAIGVAVLPSLSRMIASNGKVVNHEVTGKLLEALAMVAFLMMACFAFLLVNAEYVIALLFKHGAFSLQDTINTSEALFAYSFGILAYGMIKVMSSFYYAVERTKFAMKTAIIGIALNLIGNLLLVEKFRHVGLAYTSSLTLSFNAGFLVLGLYPYREHFSWAPIVRFIVLLLTGTVAAIVLQKIMITALGQFFIIELNKVDSIVVLSANGVLLVLSFAMIAKLIIGKSWKELGQSFRQLRKRSNKS